MEFGYFFSDFPSEARSGIKYFLKCLTFIVLSDKYGPILFDTGSPADSEKVINILYNKFNLTPKDVTWIFNTHIHPDHVGNNNLYTNAKIVLSKKDFEFALNIANASYSSSNFLEYLHTKCPGYKTSFTEFEANQTKNYIKTYWSIEKIGIGKNAIYIEDNPIIPEFINIIPTAGHTFYHYCYILNFENKKIIITGDALSNRLVLDEEDKNIRFLEPHMDFNLYFQSLDFLKKEKCLFVPGHDRPFYSETGIGIKKYKFKLQDLEV